MLPASLFPVSVLSGCTSASMCLALKSFRPTGGRIYILGGIRPDNSASAFAQFWDIGSEFWNMTQNMNNPRYGAAAAYVSGECTCRIRPAMACRDRLVRGQGACSSLGDTLFTARWNSWISTASSGPLLPICPHHGRRRRALRSAVGFLLPTLEHVKFVTTFVVQNREVLRHGRLELQRGHWSCRELRP
jgi:hypothetical protein